MERHRKSDQYYIDEYDRITIGILKEKATLLEKAQKDLEEDHPDVYVEEVFALSLNYSECGVGFAKNKRETINRWMERDERKSELRPKS